MRLTEAQKKRIAAYLREIAWDMGEVPDGVCKARLRQLNQLIAAELHKLGTPLPSNDQLERVLAKCRPSEYGVAQSAIDDDAVETIAESANRLQKRIWLGVCAQIAEETGLPLLQVRLLFLALGVAGPLAIVTYLACFVGFAYAGRLSHLPPIRWRRLISFTVAAAGIATVLFAFVKLLLFALNKGYARFLEGDLPRMHGWTWALDNLDRHFFWVLVTLVPLAVLGSLPLANGWDDTLRKLVKAALAVYALVLSMALAAAVTGVVMGAAEQLF